MHTFTVERLQASDLNICNQRLHLKIIYTSESEITLPTLKLGTVCMAKILDQFSKFVMKKSTILCIIL
jgi:hypothetical protein